MFRTQHNSWIHLLAIVCVIALGLYLELSLREWSFLSFAIGLVLVAEMINTAIEFLGDAITEEQNDNIKNAKDVAAGAVLIAAIIAIATACFIFIPKLISHLAL